MAPYIFFSGGNRQFDANFYLFLHLTDGVSVKNYDLVTRNYWCEVVHTGKFSPLHKKKKLIPTMVFYFRL